jgi:hypothetical protein
MDPKQHIIDQIFLDIDADVKTIDRITSFMRTMLADGDERKDNMEEISKLPKSKLYDQGLIYNLMLNEKWNLDGCGSYVFKVVYRLN